VLVRVHAAASARLELECVADVVSLSARLRRRDTRHVAPPMGDQSVMTSPPRHPCAWVVRCDAIAIKERWEPFTGKYRPACATHCAPASPFELRELGAKDAS
jgi:hypothetical protein